MYDNNSAGIKTSTHIYRTFLLLTKDNNVAYPLHCSRFGKSGVEYNSYID